MTCKITFKDGKELEVSGDYSYDENWGYEDGFIFLKDDEGEITHYFNEGEIRFIEF